MEKSARQRWNWLNDQRAAQGRVVRGSDNYGEVFAGFAKRGKRRFYSLSEKLWMSFRARDKNEQYFW